MVKKRIFSLVLIVCLLVSMMAIPSNAIAGEIVIGGGAALVAVLLSAGATVSFLDAARPAIDRVAEWFNSLGSPVTATVNPVDGTVSMDADDYNNSLAFIQEWNANNTYIAPPALNFNQAEYLEYTQTSGNEKGTVGFLNGTPNTFTPSVAINTSSASSGIFVASKAFQFDAETYPDGTTISITVGALYNGNKPFFRFARYASTATNRYGSLQYFDVANDTWSYFANIGDNGLSQDVLVDDVRDMVFRLYLGISKDSSNSGSPASAGSIYPIYGSLPKLVASNGALSDTGFQQNIPSNEELEEKKVPAGTGLVSWRPTTVDGNNALENADASNAEIVLIQSYLNGGGSSEPEPEDPNNLPYIPFLTNIRNRLDAIGNEVSGFKDFMRTIGDAILAMKDALLDFLSDPLGALQRWLHTIGEEARGYWDAAKGFFTNVASWFNTVIQTLADILHNIGEIAGGLLTWLANQFDWLANLPLWLQNVTASLGNIWHYPVAWVGSLGAGLSVFASVWSSLPYAMVLPIYATAVIVIVIGVYKRFFM